MTKQEFYDQRKALFQEQFAEFRKTEKCREAAQAVADVNGVTAALVKRIIYSKDYLTDTTLTETT